MPSSETPSLLPGMPVDWEMKALLIAFVYAVAKVVAWTPLNTTFITFSRGLFVAGHLFFGYVYFSTNRRISKSTSRSDREKDLAKESCREILKSLFVRAVIVMFIHFRSQMVQPLIISLFMGFFSMIENGYIYQVMYDQTPKVFELFFR